MTDKEHDEAIIDIQKRLKELEDTVTVLKQKIDKPIDGGSFWPKTPGTIDGGTWQ